MEFSEVLYIMKMYPDRAFRRKCWKDKHISLTVFYTVNGTPYPLVPDDEKSPVRAHIDVCENGVRYVGWNPDPSDLLADDWEECRWTSVTSLG